MSLTPRPPRLPRVACEIGAGHLFAARMPESASRVDVLLSRTIPEGSVIPSLTNPNIADAGTIKAVLSEALLAAAGKVRDVSLVVPDATVRVLLLDLDTLPPKKAEADAIVRFRLKRTLPFDVDKAAISYHASPDGTGLKLVVVVMLNSVLQEYESVVRDAGYQPGLVLPFTLAALGNISESSPTMTVSVAQGSTTIAILDRENLFFYRTLDHDIGETPDAIAEAVYPSVVFFQDTYGKPVQRILLSGIQSADTVASVIAEEMSVEVAELVSPALSDIASPVSRSQLSGVLGVLVQ